MQGIVEYLLACGKHQRAHDASHLLVYARKTSETCASHQVDEEGLYRVVDVVCYGDGGIVKLLAELGKPGVAQTACSHLHRFARELHLGLGVETSVVALDAIAAGCLLHQYLIFVTLGSTQAEVAVCNAHVVAAVYA